METETACRIEGNVSLQRLTPTIGGILDGVDLSRPIADEILREIEQALMDCQVIFFRGQNLTRDQQKALGARLGQVEPHKFVGSHPEGHPDIYQLVNDAEINVGSDRWHSDVTNDPEPPMGAILCMRELPAGGGGDTLWASMYAAYEALSEPMKTFLLSLSAIHDGRAYQRQTEQRLDVEVPATEHPIVRTHPVTGKRSLFVNRVFTRRIPKLSPGESDVILDFLYRHIENPAFHCRYAWSIGDVAIWDNRCTQHFAVHDYWPDRRVVERVTLKGDKPFLRLD